jgi:radical SAM protein with 4Fe4S-binding SPASM domain
MRLISNASRFMKLFSSRLMGKKIPWSLSFLITERCNLRCYYCFVDVARQMNAPEKKLIDMPLDDIKHIMKSFYLLGNRYLILMGGEPLVRKDIDEIIDYGKGMGAFVEINSNGTLVEQRMREIKNIDSIVLSLEGPEEIHDAERGSGSYRKLMTGLDHLKTNGIPIKFNFTLTKNNLAGIEHVIEISKDYGALVTIGEATKNFEHDVLNKNLPTPGQLSEFWKRILTYKLQGVPILKTIRSIEYLIASSDLIGHEEILYPGDSLLKELQYYPCQYGRYAVMVGPDGMLYPCTKLYGKYGVNIFEQGVETAWNELSQKLDCISCRMSLLCNLNGCLGLDPTTVFDTIKATVKNYR